MSKYIVSREDAITSPLPSWPHQAGNGGRLMRLAEAAVASRLISGIIENVKPAEQPAALNEAKSQAEQVWRDEFPDLHMRDEWDTAFAAVHRSLASKPAKAEDVQHERALTLLKAVDSGCYWAALELLALMQAHPRLLWREQAARLAEAASVQQHKSSK